MTLDDALLDAPDWNGGGRVHNWKNYISDELKELWPTFSSEQRIAIARNADDLAGREDWE